MADTIVDYTADGYVATGPDFTPVSVGGNQLPGEVAVAVTPPYTEAPAPDFSTAGGYVPGQIGSIGGGYDPNNPSYGDAANSIGGAAAVTDPNSLGPNYDLGAGGYVPGQEITSGGGYDPTTAGLSDPTNARNAISGLNPGGAAAAAAVSPSVAFQSVNGTQGAGAAADSDWRVRISLADNAKIFYKDASNTNLMMAPLVATSGVIFPYTPSISVTHSANYESTSLMHSNYNLQFFKNSEVQDITITGDFTVQSVQEGQYLMAAVYFFRAASKMFFGSGTNVGNPPPIVFLDGYGSHYFPHVPCVLSGFTHTLSPDVDYIEVPITTTTLQNVSPSNPNIGSVQLTAAEQQNVPSLLQSSASSKAVQQPTATVQSITKTTRVPTSSSISITLKPVYSRKNLHDNFDLNKFAAGQLLQNKTTGTGGFL